MKNQVFVYFGPPYSL